ncbi:type I-F CRISPR-associated protein Csy3 [Paraburkholderia elongata]|uniref:Type I-F CRISPR-associated protein Csy3 n=1 Tax=Paraburkholderia elongata TaxID=2675747 RepID=A0A972NYZ2_9BURK|nr:type I-F CRISPR-associated protein Csy3 [Paraburkholderia elongata]NPT60332.1 type I-F CRISPR-associated protein Csy3 [Paraburkholderia elongata]
MTKNELKTASVLAFARKLDPSDACFTAGRWNDRENGEKWPPVSVREKSVRGTISDRRASRDQDPAKLDTAIQSPNLHTVDVATLPNDVDTLRVRFTLRVLGGAGMPSACNNADYQEKLQTTIQQYVDQTGFAELARRYALNLANGRFLWRNRVSAEQIEVQVRHLSQGSANKIWIFDALSFSLRDFKMPTDAEQSLKALAQVIEQGLASKAYGLLEVVAYARVGDGQEVFPSQELILDRGDKKGQKSKTLYAVGEVAGIHSQKIGNALRTIDTWYPDDGGPLIGPIAVEPYGSVTSQGIAYRRPQQKMDFYNLLDNWVLKDSAPDEGNQHYVMATLIRGGVFGQKD